MILFAHPTGNANVRHAALALHRANLLGEFWTCLNYRDRSLLNRFLPRPLIRQLRRRTNPKELQPYLHTFPFRELMRLLAPRAGLNELVRHETGVFSVDSVYHSLDRHISHRLADPQFDAVYAYEDGAEHAFRAAARLGRLAFYDLPIGYWRAARAILTEEAGLQPAWASTLAGNKDSQKKADRKDAELALADVVFVASSFTHQTLDSAPPFKAPVVVTPYGAPAIPAVLPAPAPRPPGDTLRVLFVGSLGQRKGLSYLFEACRQLQGAIELTVIGTRPQVDCAILDRELANVRWIASCPHHQVLTEMAAHDVFVFPSLFEGFGLVLLEAMAMGLPIITTAHTAGPDLIEEGKEGFIVPIRSSRAIAEKLALLHENRALRDEMSRNARKRAGEFTWDDYGAKLSACIQTALSHRTASTHA
jgi:glycosyltransferase involved in cell wall biosynthesis